MKLLLINASPKKKGGASRFFTGFLRLFLPGVQQETVSLRGRPDFETVLANMKDADGVCLSFPLYVDGLPAHVVEFLTLAEPYCREHRCRFRLYALANNGFVEGRQNSPALGILEAWCQRAGVTWSGGIGVGGGVMLRVLAMVYPILLALTVLQLILSGFSQEPDLSGLLVSLLLQGGTWLFLNAGLLLALLRLSAAIRGGKSLPNFYTRVMLPVVLFLPVASIFMALSSLFHGRFLPALFGKDRWNGS